MVTGKINDYPAVRTNQMVVMLWGTDCVAAADTSGV